MEAKINSINIYEKPDYCPQCNMTKKEFKRRLGEAAYESLVKTEELTPETIEQFKAMGFLSAPVVEVHRSGETVNNTTSPETSSNDNKEESTESIERWAGYRPELIKKAAAEAAIVLAQASSQPSHTD